MIHRTLSAEAAVHETGWFELPGTGYECSKLPLIDTKRALPDETPLFARLTHADAKAWCAANGCELPRRQHFEALLACGLIIEPHTINPDSQELWASEQHDGIVWARLRARGWDGSLPVCGAGKHHRAGAPPKRAYLGGWYTHRLQDYGPRTGVGWVQRIDEPVEDGGSDGPHGDGIFDYGTTTWVVRKIGAAAAFKPFVALAESAIDAVERAARHVAGLLANGDPAALPTSAAVLRLGSSGALVARWQRIISVTANGDFDTTTERWTRVWQTAHGLVADGVVGPRSWAEALHDGGVVVPHSPTVPTPLQIGMGVDVSQWQPPGLVDYRALAAAGHGFVIARATYGTLRDLAFAGHVAAARAAGLQVGGYHFFRQHLPMHEQLDAFRAALSAGGIGDGDIVPAIDLETNSSGADGALDPTAHNRDGRAIVEDIADKFGEALVYLSPGHWVELGRPSWPSEHAVWVADWRPAAAPVWPADWAIWQSSASYRSAAFPRGPFDLDRARRLPTIRRAAA